ncbi:MAG: HAD family phosphatase [Acidobacteria bacterium]|nr:HAD family phosphatase [Acidobacteriota bacterium]MYC83293.1 HAD family phosphatase [Acidobacteriota bacterium]
MIKVICLDLGKVIVDYDPTIPLNALGTRSALSLPEIMQVLTDREPLLLFDRGRYSRSDFYRTMCARLKLDVSTEEFERLWTSLFLPEPLLPESFLLSLKRRYRLLMLSNVNEVHFEFIWKNYPLVHHIEDRLLSYELGCLKPEPAIYRIAIDRAGVRPQEIFFADDRPENVEAARQAGIVATRFQSEQQLKLALGQAGVVIE